MFLKNIFKYIFILWFCFFPPIAIHELGHFVVGKLTNIGTEEISIGFGPGLSTNFNEDVYSIRALPLGGYVKLKNDNREVYHKEHLITLLFGPINNFILAFLCFLIYYYQIFSNILKNKNGNIFRFKNKKIFDKISHLTYSIDQNNSIKVITVTDEDFNKIDTNIIRKSILMALKKTNIFSFKDQYTKDISRIFFLQDIQEKASVVGPIGIFAEAVKHLNRSFLSLVYFTGELSLGIGLFNLLPIFPLDGGKIWPIILKIKDASTITTAEELSIFQIIGLSIFFAFFIYIFLRDLGINMKKLYFHWRKK